MFVVTKLAPAGKEIVEYERDFFLERVWEYNPGERVSILGPSGAGKGVLSFQLLEATVTPQIQPVIFVTKGRDETIETWAKGLDYKIIKTWPPRFNPFESTPPAGYVLWPEEDPNDYQNTLRIQRAIFVRALNDIYNFYKRQKNRPKDKRLDGMIAVIDEMSEVSDEMDLDDQVERFDLTSPGCGVNPSYPSACPVSSIRPRTTCSSHTCRTNGTGNGSRRSVVASTRNSSKKQRCGCHSSGGCMFAVPIGRCAFCAPRCMLAANRAECRLSRAPDRRMESVL